ncbi:MAG: hypothetical protein VW416_04185 [Gammaproteobacteria bacterium]
MFKKIIQLTIILFVLNGCGYTPMYSTNFKNDFNIELIDFKGDNDLNNFIKQKIDGLINTEKKNSKTFQVSLNTSYSKDVQIKDKSGKATQYSLNANASFIIEINDKLEEISFNEKTSLTKFNDEFEEANYERSFKENISQIFVNKLIIYLSRIK